MSKRILFSDLDGTLLDDEKKITPGNQAAIDKALENGHYIVVSTGRPLVSANIQIERLGLNKPGCYAITFNGSQIVNTATQEVIYGNPVDPDTVQPLFDEASRRGLHIQTYDSTAILSEHDNEALRKYAGTALVPYKIVNRISEHLQEAPYKMIAISYDDPEKLKSFQKEVVANYSDKLHSFFSNDNFLEIVPKGISKGFAVEWLCNYLNIPIENSVAAGDAQNDVAMLEAAHIGAVMCNAFPGIAEHGNYITKADNNHDGVAEIIYKFIL